MAKTLFDHLNAIYTNQSVDYFDTLDDADKKTFNVFMINRLVSMTPEYAGIAAQFARFFGLVGPRETYLFYSQILPKGKQYSKYIKAEKQEKYEEWLVKLIAMYFRASEAQAVTYLELCYQTAEGKADLKSIATKFGTDPKKIKKAKLL